MRDCKSCVNCSMIRCFMCECRVSYEKEEDGIMYHVQEGKSVKRSFANKCEHYSEKEYGRDLIFAL